MESPTPPPSPIGQPALHTYIRALATLIPTTMVWIFADIVLSPKLEKIWTQAGLDEAKIAWLITTSHLLHDHFTVIVSTVLALFLLVEFRWMAWSRYRRPVVAIVVFLFHTSVLIGITIIATAALLAAPMLTQQR